MLQILGSGYLQLGEERVCTGIRAGHCGADPAQHRCQYRVNGTQARQESTHCDGLTREVHDVCQCQHRGNGQNRPAHTVDDRTELGENGWELETIPPLLVEEEVNNRNDQARDNQQSTGV